MPRSQRLKAQRAAEVPKPRSLFTDGLIIAGATAAAYLLTFAYEYGYCAYFGIPGFLIEPSTGTILFAAMCILGAIILLIEMSHLPRELLVAIPWPRLRIRLILIALMWITPMLTGAPFRWLMMLSLITWTLILLSDYIFALIFTDGSFIQRMSRGEAETATSKSAWDGVKRAFGATAVGLVLIIYMALLRAWIIGTTHARFQDSFIVLKSAPDIAVIKRYGDRLIAIRYEGTPPRATGEFRVIDKDQAGEFINLNKISIESVRRQIDNDSKSKN
ncbi:hypothetical protein [Paracidovorax valerianellae]|uniref:Uncharacterized protein n=1 Tax=Paracidovorax valerianellae TaxID=187868 RepID=A0A1G6P9A0_9BURK|nr:hypothetical protein [Paracidovorax valerianellae]MDA8444803.1 hypothetical protein [Paracidovorax valerianellae]SDC76076.1 hypothetical protein SAMN05192589_103164 [Paracidovorax valerianellae]